MLSSPFPDVVTEAHVERLQAVSKWIRTQSVGSPRALTLTICALPAHPPPQHR